MNAFDRTGPVARRHAPSRRGFIISAAMAGGGLIVGCSPKSMAGALSLGAAPVDFGPFGAFVKIQPDGWVTVVSKHQEMGQGAHAGLAALVAEELDADWDKVRVEFAPANAKVYGNPLLGGVQATGGSTAMANAWLQYRKAGAAARAMLIDAAAARWQAPAAELATRDGVVSHAASGRSAPYGELLGAAAAVHPPQDPPLKPPSAFRLMGTSRVARKDAVAKSTGAVRYTQDVHLPDMLTAMVAHSPRFGGAVQSFDDAEARKVPGVVDLVRLPTGVAVIAESTYAAKTGRAALKVTWNDDQAEKRSTDEILADFHRIAQGGTDVKPQVFQTKGDGTSAFQGDLFEATYDFPYLAHAPMEPMNCVAQVDGDKVKLTYCSQMPTGDQLNTALVVGALPGSIEIETLMAGGSFGRRGNWVSDYVVEAARIAKHVGGGRPVKLVWTREDDMAGGHYRPMAHHVVAVKLAPDGYPAAWRHRVVCQSIMKGSPMGVRFDGTTVEGVKGSPYLAATPVVDGQVYMPDLPVTAAFWRSVGASHSALVMEHTIDRLARRAGKDPADYRRELYRRAGADRQLAVLNLACEKAGWGKPMPAGTVQALAVHECFGTVVAQVGEVSLKDGEPRVGRVVCAIDCGFAVAPNLVAAQMESGVCFGLSAALYGQITLKDGVVQETNFDRYSVLRMNAAPRVETYIIPSANPPTGAGEPGTPLIAPIVANALLVLTHQPTSRLPLVTGA